MFFFFFAFKFEDFCDDDDGDDGDVTIWAMDGYGWDFIFMLLNKKIGPSWNIQLCADLLVYYWWFMFIVYPILRKFSIINA